MKIDIKTVDHIAKLSKLKFNEKESLKLTTEFETILSHFDLIDNIDLSDVKLDEYSEDLKSVLRKDVTLTFEDKDKLFRNVKSKQGTSIKVPKILE
ncbi:MAG: Asp-tRNA(Asn)/Glu-tRNA(Gln) amidotransferase subunit GatC [Clostridiaceae bacterium]